MTDDAHSNAPDDVDWVVDDAPVRSRLTVVQWVILSVFAAAILVLLFTTVFPWVEQQLEDPVLGASPVTHSVQAVQ